MNANDNSTTPGRECRVRALSEMKGGWFVGDFDPCILRSKDAEVAIKTYKAGQTEARHYHKVAVEITAVTEGRARMNDTILSAGDIIRLEPGMDSDFEALEDCVTVVVKQPSVAGDKYIGKAP